METNCAIRSDFKQSKQKIKVLIIDDEVDIRDIISTTLTRSKTFDVETVLADSGRCIERLLKLHSPDMVVLDRCFPAEDPTGDEILKRIYETGSTRQVIMFSSDSNLSFNEIEKIKIPKRYLMTYVTILNKAFNNMNLNQLLVQYFSKI